MAAYYRQQVEGLLEADVNEIVGVLQHKYASDGFSTQYTRASESWRESVPLLKQQLTALVKIRPEAAEWTILLEYPLYRLRRRIDAIILAGPTIVVVEFKVGSSEFNSADQRQVEEYALDLRDFHAESNARRIIPVLWSTNAVESTQYRAVARTPEMVAPVVRIGQTGLAPLLISIEGAGDTHIVAEQWDRSPYRPVPSVIEAATNIFAGHDVRSIANADAENLQSASTRLVELIREARDKKERYLILLTGVPGSGKTLAGLYVVHSALGIDQHGDTVYLSGNTPLVAVLREALARDEDKRIKSRGGRRTLQEIRSSVRARIQHINDYLQEGFRGSPDVPPHDHVIVFDEAQRAWDEKQGLEKFNRTASEPVLILELMQRHQDWCVCVCLVGGGQEINSGEEGVWGWGEAVRKLAQQNKSTWKIYAPPDVVQGGPSAGKFTLGPMPAEVVVQVEPSLQLLVPQRSYRSPSVSSWVNAVLAGDEAAARESALRLGPYPILVTRSLNEAKGWLRTSGRGERRFGLVASSGARRLRADGLGTMLHAAAGDEIAHWYLNEPGDIRSSFALEVPANEYTCQGLELDFAAICWGGDFLWDTANARWAFKRLSGNAWKRVQSLIERQFIENTYRVLLTRAREGMILWVPSGDDNDSTRACGPLDDTVNFLVRCGAHLLPEARQSKA
ncbi:DNA/RNA helicase domain-containing protein [Pseudoduganella sp. GCM10020061]|uniref:DNA/RNA helicase domain-containing protein n=1 Tax=Pseudoduganella sp. GCM10020061 TaxID=3317345 RepID=UPI003626F715